MVAESWFHGPWGMRWKNAAGSQNVVIGVLAFESASLMSKVVHLWQSLSDKNINRLRVEIADSVGIKKLVLYDNEVIVQLICSEMIENMRNIARSVGRLGKKCTDPDLESFEAAFENLMKTGVDPCGWKLTWKKMEGKIRKMERFVAVNANLYLEMEVLAELEQTLKIMKSNDGDQADLLEDQKMVVWKRHEVKTLQEISLWNKNYDYVVQLLARSLFTVFARIKHVFGIQQLADVGDIKDPKALSSNHMSRSQPLSALLQSSVHPSENNHARFFSGALGRSTGKSVPILKASNAKTFYSGPLGSSNMKASIFSEIDNPIYSGPLGYEVDSNLSSFSSKTRLLNAPPESLGAAGLALHYANVIIVIQKLAEAPHLIGLDARDDLYNMLPASVRTNLKSKLKPCTKSLASLGYDTSLAGEWSEAISRILNWLAPLAHDMIRWQSEQSFEQQNLVSNMLLVQTLPFTSQIRRRRRPSSQSSSWA
ncbi:hypothetical protein BT93_C0931 [Corymbia citriodora subsp. variegata]|nr:hypothetical protein BT93_C0931 [Corymbia citriodora subsp. variegata]